MKVDIFNTDRKYDIIYADPPWNDDYHSGGLKNGRGLARQHYNVMTTQEIKSLPVSNLSKENSILFLWATFPCLRSALQVIEAWGFEYKTIGFTWVKQNKKSESLFWGGGNYTRSNAEICLIGVSKEFKSKRDLISHGVHSVVISHRREHSRKPDEVREKIIELCGDKPRIELFARQSVDGWDCWGNEV